MIRLPIPYIPILNPVEIHHIELGYSDYPTRMDLRCFLFGHPQGANDSGFNVCDRCGMHQCYDSETYGREAVLSYRLYRFRWFLAVRTWANFRWYIYRRFSFCMDCRKKARDCSCLPF